MPDNLEALAIKDIEPQVTKLVSPVYVEKFIRWDGIPYETFAPTPRAIYEDHCQEDKLLATLNKVKLFSTNGYIGEKAEHRNVYLIAGTNGTMCAISPEIKAIDESAWPNRRDKTYTWEVTIQSQPSGRPLPRELQALFDSMGYNPLPETPQAH